ncbi:MAG TPA: hypothetical protein VE933_05820 [Chitinophagaceae bacterium]|nr:hypothetical protein [Chitinophagaceae bacterium]
MIFDPLNLEQELIHERMKQQRLMDDVHRLLDEVNRRDEEILRRLKEDQAGSEFLSAIDEDDSKNIFSLKEIRNTCIKYRLRFLKSSYFKAAFPYEALMKIKEFEKKYGVEISNFKIIAPDHAFDLQNINKDPLLFAQLSDDSFYLLHKWGKDLAWYKKFLFLPLQNPVIFFLTLLAFCIAGAAVIPVQWMNVLNFESEIFLRLWLCVHFFIMFSGIVLWIGISFSKNFSCNTWNSKYYNW